MELAIIGSRAIDGLLAPAISVEAHLVNGLPVFNLVGLADTEVREARDRVRAALLQSGFEFPQKRITVNLAPADLPKEGGRFDLPIAIGVLVASGQIRRCQLDHFEFVGELSLAGHLRPVSGALALAAAAKRQGRCVILPQQNLAEASLINGAEILGATHLMDVVQFINTGKALLGPLANTHIPQHCYPDLADVKGQLAARRSLEIAAAGRHSLLYFGPPGSGKSMLAERLPGLLPALDDRQAITVASLESLDGSFQLRHWRRRPFRQPHHSASMASLVGGGSNPRPGEISLAHHGVLFLDELAEFDRRVLEALREPLQSGRITISRARKKVSFPAKFQLLAAMNPCPCGYYGDKIRNCRCSPEQINRYRNKLSGPLLDRIDLICEVAALSDTELFNRTQAENSASVAERVALAWQRQRERQQKANSQLGGDDLERYCQLDTAGEAMLKQAMRRLRLSARSTHRILRVARSIADLATHKQIELVDLAEAIAQARGAQLPGG